MDITCSNCEGTGHDVDFDCVCYLCNGSGRIATTKPVDGPTDKQLDFIANLERQRAFDPAVKPELTTKKQASGWIDFLQQQPRRTASAKAVGKGLPGEGFYMLQQLVDGGVHLSIVKVQIAKHGSGNVYAKRLDPITGRFEYESGLINRMDGARNMTPEDAKMYGDLYGRCFKCGAELTDEQSIARGMGPVCAAKMGW